MSSSPVSLKILGVGEQCRLNLSRAQTSSLWWGVCQLRCRPRHLTMVQNYEVRRQKLSYLNSAVSIFTHSPEETQKLVVTDLVILSQVTRTSPVWGGIPKIISPNLLY
ncbi:hypothetical protein TNCV_2926551 [Trichonephila clavipes]|nr:hypothetical protein TNCV_2926551 [Trichonephila clavipes]